MWLRISATSLIGELENQLQQQVEEKILFIFEWELK